MNIDAIRLGLPSEERMQKLRVWDSYFTPAHSHPGTNGTSRLYADIERSMSAIRKGHFEKLCYFPHVGIGTTSDPQLERLLSTNPGTVEAPLQRYPELLIGMIQLNPNSVDRSLDAINRWLRDGPMLGVYFPGSGPGSLTCSHKNFHRIVERIIDVRGVIMQHTWYKTGGKQGPGESTPAELAELAARFPEQPFLCAHGGGEWEQGLRAVRRSANVYVETSGFDSTAGFLEMAIREVGARRIIFGSHLPSRSLGTELGKVIGAQLSDDERRLILGGNYRRILKPVLGRTAG